MQQFCDVNLAFSNPLYWVLLLSLFVFGVGYNIFVTWLNRRGWENGVTAPLVIIGVAVTVTIGVLPIFGKEPVFYLLTIFVASGVPVTFGAISRYLKERTRIQEDMMNATRQALEARKDGNGG